MTVEANPETVTPALAALLREHGVNRVSLGAQSFPAALLDVLERAAGPDDVRRAVQTLRDAGFDNISLDLIYGIPGQSPADLDADLADALALEPEHLSCYELEAKPGTRFTHTHGEELARQAEAMEGYFEQVVDDADRRRLPLVRDGELLPRRATGRDLRARHNLGYWRGARLPRASGSAPCRRSPVSGGGTRLPWRATSRPSARARGRRGSTSSSTPRRGRPSGSCSASGSTSPWRSRGLEPVVDRASLERSSTVGLVERVDGEIRLTQRGRLLGDGVTAELLA